MHRHELSELQAIMAELNLDELSAIRHIRAREAAFLLSSKRASLDNLRVRRPGDRTVPPGRPFGGLS